MKTIKSIEWRAKRSALKKVLFDLTSNIQDEIVSLTMWIEDEEKCATVQNGGMPDDITKE